MTNTIVPKGTVKYGRVDQSKITYDPRVQRVEGVDMKRVRAMAAEFNPASLGTITVSARADGTMVVLDGAHRVAAAKVAGYTKSFHAMIHTGLTLAEEAGMFDQLNTFKQPSIVSRMLARRLAGDQAVDAMFSIIESHGWYIRQAGSDWSFAAVGAAERVYESCAGARKKSAYPDVLDMTISTLTQAWGHDRDGVHQMLVQGVGQVYGRFADQVSVEGLSKAISRERPVAIRALAKALQGAQGGTTTSAAAKVMVGLYNKNRRTNKLPDWVWTR